MIDYLSIRVKDDFELALSPMPMMKDVPVEVAIGKEQITMLYPTSSNLNIDFNGYGKYQLGDFSLGLRGQQPILTVRKTFVNKKYVDAFVNCMKEIFGIDWHEVYVNVNLNEGGPIFLISKTYSFVIANMTLSAAEFDFIQKYDPTNPNEVLKSEQYIEQTQKKDAESPKKEAKSLPIFIVHGKNEAMKQAVARVLEKLDIEPIILQEQANEGRTIIEKFVESSNVGYAIVLLSPDDYGYSVEAKAKKAMLRARQNAILELGFFVGKLGRNRVMALYQQAENFEMPSDFLGVAYTAFDVNGNWQLQLVRELRANGYKVDANKLI